MRLQLALNVDNLDEAVEFYSTLFATEPNKRKPGYANFAIEEPPLKLVLLEFPNAPERLNHLGVECFEQADVTAATMRFRAAGIADEEETDSTCCHAKQNKIWSKDPQGMPWEWYRILENTEAFGNPNAGPAQLGERVG